MSKNKLKIVLILFVFCLFATVNAFASKEVLVKVNGEKTDMKAVVVNGSALLPLRDTLHSLGFDDISWNQETSTATLVTGNMTTDITIGEDVAYSAYGLNNRTSWQLIPTPRVIDGKTYVPSKFIDTVFFPEIEYRNSTVLITKPFKYTNGAWYRALPYSAWDKVTVNNTTTQKHGDTIYIMLSMYMMGSESKYIDSSLYALNAQGDYKLVAVMPPFTMEYRISNNNLYYQFNTSILGGYDLIYKTSLDDIYHTVQLGRKNFSYGSKLVFSGNKSLIPDTGEMAFNVRSIRKNWEIKPEGVYAIGYQWESAVEGTVFDLTLLKETYGYYLLDETGNHKLIKKLEVE